jgi:peptidoglycan-N-acetylglucosamine deacetylase
VSNPPQKNAQDAEEPDQDRRKHRGQISFWQSQSNPMILFCAVIVTFAVTFLAGLATVMILKPPLTQSNQPSNSQASSPGSGLSATPQTQPPSQPQPLLGNDRFVTSSAPSPLSSTQSPIRDMPTLPPENQPSYHPRLDITHANRQTILATMPPNSIALTFDDGPDLIYTTQILEKLRKYNVKATFFLVGFRVREHCGVVQQVVAEGHELGNHTFTHPRLPELSLQAQKKEIEDTQTAITQCVGAVHRPRWFRAPYGRQNSITFSILSQLGLSSALWSIDTRDWNLDSNSQIIADSVLQARGQDIVVMHDGLEANEKYRHLQSATTRDATIGSLDLFLTEMQAKGFKFVTLSQALLPNRSNPVSLAQ